MHDLNQPHQSTPVAATTLTFHLSMRIQHVAQAVKGWPGATLVVGFYTAWMESGRWSSPETVSRLTATVTTAARSNR